MAACEEICWEALRKARGESVSSDWLRDETHGQRFIRNAIPISVLKGDLVLHHKKTDIEDSLRFLETRGYLLFHGSRDRPRNAYSLSDVAIRALELGLFPEEEQQALSEAR